MAAQYMLKRIKDFLEFYPDSDEQYWTREIEENFGSAKALSDFISMLVQLSFLSVAIKYFYSKGASSESLFLLASYGSCALVMLSLSAALIYKISSIVAGFFLQGAVHQKKRWGKYLIFVFAIIQTVRIMNGVTQLIDDLAGTHALEREMHGKR